MKYKILAFALIISLIVSLSGCFGRGTRDNKQHNSSANKTGQSVSPESGDNSKADLEAAFLKYIQAWQNNDFKAMYSLLVSGVRERIPEEDFIKRYETIHKALEIKNLVLEPEFPESLETDEFGSLPVLFNASMATAAGEIMFANTAMLRKEDYGSLKKWKVVWTPAMIFPGMEEGDTVKIARNPGKRGEIRDRIGAPLAVEGLAAEIGIVPGKLGESAEESIKEISGLLGMSPESINKKLSASYVKPDMFIPLKVVSKEHTETLDKLTQIPGIMMKDKKIRTYPLKEKAAHLTGYMQQLSQEDLKKLESEGYSANDSAGKAGLEKIYEKEFRPENGAEVYIENKYGTKKEVLASKEPKAFSDVTLTIDSAIQSAIYDELKQDKAAGIAINPKTGEVLALVSTPSYDPNSFILGMTADTWNAVSQDAAKPLFNRFQGRFIPGSSFKAVTAAIGLKTGTLDPEAVLDTTGLKWQKDKSWGKYFVTRVRSYKEPSNLLHALMYSDNIYFARQALNIGTDTFLNEIGSFGIGEEIPFEYPLSKSQFDSDGAVKSEVQLADSGYGQGEVLMNPLHTALIYAALLNEGNIVKPTLIKAEGQTPVIWKPAAFSSEAASIIIKALIQVIENPAGTGHEAYIPGLTLAGKTGTAEVKTGKKDAAGTELGWFIAMDTINQDLLVLMMVEDVKGRGGSHYVVPKVRRIMEKFAGK